MAALFFDHSEFVASHGKAPSGRGSWAFKFGDRHSGFALNPEAGEHLGRDLAEVFWAPSGLLFSEAKKWARAKAKELGAGSVRVCS